MLEWNKFDADGLEGMEAFHDDVATHIIKYEHGEGFIGSFARGMLPDIATLPEAMIIRKQK